MKQKQLLCENWKSLVYWQSKLTFCYKKNVLTEELRRTKKKKITTCFEFNVNRTNQLIFGCEFSR